MGFNVSYLIDVLSTIQSEKVKITLSVIDWALLKVMLFWSVIILTVTVVLGSIPVPSTIISTAIVPTFSSKTRVVELVVVPLAFADAFVIVDAKALSSSKYSG